MDWGARLRDSETLQTSKPEVEDGNNAISSCRPRDNNTCELECQFVSYFKTTYIYKQTCQNTNMIGEYVYKYGAVEEGKCDTRY